MNYPPKIKKQIQTWSNEAYRRELEREVERLEKDIHLFKLGRISSEEFRHRMYEWVTGPSKALGKQYDYGQVDNNVAYAVAIGILNERELSDELRDILGTTLEIYKEMKADGKLSNRKGKWWE